MIAPYNNIGGMGSLDYSSLMNDPYLLAALQSYNPNFKASQTSLTQTQTADNSAAYTSNSSYIPVDYATVKPDNSNTGLWVTGAIGAAALIGLGIKGNGDPLKGAQALWENLFKSGTRNVSNSTVSTLKNLQVIRHGEEVKCFVPGQKFTINGNDNIVVHLKKYGISPTEITNLKNGTNKVNSCTFEFETGDVVTFEGDKIVKIINKKGKNITKNFFGKGVTLEGDNLDFINRLKAHINIIKNMEKGWNKGICGLNVTRTVGDNVARVNYNATKGKKVVINELNTLKPLDTTDDAVKSWAYEHPEAKVVLEKGAFETFAVPKGMKATTVDIPSNGIIYHFKDGKIVSITKGRKTFAKGKTEYNVALIDNEEKMKEVYEQLISGENISKKYRSTIDFANVKVNYAKA